jgi:ABC-2 type transport system ATP-binding protein
MQITLQCPHCKHIETYEGSPGTQIVVICPSCGQHGRVTFPGALPQTNQTAIEVEKLTKKYGNLVAVNGISFSVRQGEIFAFLGPNGAGKTTTVEMIESIRIPTQGQIKILGKNISTSFNNVKEQIGILPQEFKSFERLTVRETLDYYSKLYEKRGNIDSILKAMDLLDHEKKLYGELSGGLKQRVGVAVSLVNDPDIIFLDEPTTGLDPKARREVWQVIANLREKGKTVFLTTHYMEEAEFLADHIAIIHQGNIIAEGSLDELITRYGKGNILRIKGCDNTTTIELLKSKGYPMNREGNGTLAISIDYKERILEVLSQLRHECIDYDSIDIRRSNLEEVFLTLTGASLSGA